MATARSAPNCAVPLLHTHASTAQGEGVRSQRQGTEDGLLVLDEFCDFPDDLLLHKALDWVRHVPNDYLVDHDRHLLHHDSLRRHFPDLDSVHDVLNFNLHRHLLPYNLPALHPVTARDIRCCPLGPAHSATQSQIDMQHAVLEPADLTLSTGTGTSWYTIFSTGTSFSTCIHVCICVYIYIYCVCVCVCVCTLLTVWVTMRSRGTSTSLSR